MVGYDRLELDDSKLRGRRVLVTGATGFVGGRLAERLILEHFCNVSTVIRNWNKAVWISRFPVDLFPGDVREIAPVMEAATNCDVVFHCASGGGSDQEYLDINIQGTRNVIEACLHHGVRRLVFISSIAVHGPNPPDSANESDDYRLSGRGYSDSKIAAEKMVLEAGKRGLEVVILRPTFVWGPRSGLFTIRPLKQMKTGIFRLVDQGNGDCHAVFIEHLVDAIIAASIKDEANGRAFLVTDQYGIKWREFFGPLQEILNIGELPSLSSRSVLTRAKCVVYQKLHEKLEIWKANPAPLWRKIARRVAKIASERLVNSGVVNRWDLIKFARIGALDTSSTNVLVSLPRYSFAEASALTEDWVRDQLGFELQIAETVRR